MLAAAGCANDGSGSSAASASSAASSAAASASASMAAEDREAADTVSRLGRVPVPTAPADAPTSSARVGRPAVLEMGAPVRATLPGGVRATLTMLGPEQSTTRPGADSTDGTFTVRVRPATGTLVVDAADFSSRNETGRSVSLRTDGPSSVTASPGHPATLRIVGRYSSGAAQVTYRHAGRLIAIWDFNIELD